MTAVSHHKFNDFYEVKKRNYHGLNEKFFTFAPQSTVNKY